MLRKVGSRSCFHDSCSGHELLTRELSNMLHTKHNEERRENGNQDNKVASTNEIGLYYCESLNITLVQNNNIIDFSNTPYHE